MHVDTLVSLLETWINSDDKSERIKAFLEIVQSIDCAGNVCIHGDFPEYTKHKFSMYGFYSPDHTYDQTSAVSYLLVELNEISITFAEEDRAIRELVEETRNQQYLCNFYCD
jgi:hypothetical protein